MLVEDEALQTSISIAKGMVYIILSALLIFYLVSRGFRSLEASKRSLSENERKIRTIFENAPQGMIEKDHSGIIVRVNSKAGEMLGMGQYELLGQKFELPGEGTGAQVGPSERTIRLERSDGSVRWLRVITTEIKDSTGQQQNLEMLSDVTGEVESSERLRQRAEEMETLFGISRGIIESELSMGSLDTMCRTAVGRMGARSAWIIINDEYGTRFLSCEGARPTVSVQDDGNGAVWHIGDQEIPSARWKDGTAISISVDGMNHVVAPLLEGGEVFGVTGFGHEDINWFTEERLATLQSFVNLFILAIQKVRMVDALKRYTNHLEDMVQDRTLELTAITHQLEEEVERTGAAQDQLYREMEKLTVTLHSIGEGVVVIDPDGTVQMANRTAEEMVRHGSQGILGENLADCLPLRDPRDDRLLPRYWSPNGGIGGANDGKAVLLDGTRKDLYFNSSPIRGQDGGTIGHVVVFRDITSEVQLQEAEGRAQRLEAIGHLAGDLAHSFNNALTSILGNLEMLGLDMGEDDPRRTWLREGQEAALRAIGLTNQLLTFSKGGQPIKKAVEPISLFEQAMRQFAQESRVKVRLGADQGLWMVEVDEMQMSQALHRTLSYMASIGDQGWMQVDIRKGPGKGTCPGTVMYRVVRPLSAKGLPVPTWQGARTENQGLDVTIAKSVVERHGGSIAFITTMDSSICEVVLPAIRPADQDATKAVTKDEKVPAKVLIMDDDPDVLEVLHEMLRKLGHRVEDSQDGAEAMSKFMQAFALGEPFDVLIMDLNVPGGMGGKEAVQRLNEKFDDVRAIVSSGYSNDPVMAHHCEFGFVGVLPKPYTMKQLSDAVQTAFAAKRSGQKKGKG